MAAELRDGYDPLREYEDVEETTLESGFGLFVDASESMVVGESREVFEECIKPLPDLDRYVAGSRDPRLDPARQQEQMRAWYDIGPEPVLSAQIWEGTGRNGDMRFVGALFTRPAYEKELRIFGGFLRVPGFSVRYPASAMLVMCDRYVVDRRFIPADAPADMVLPRRSVIVSANTDNPAAARVTIKHASRLPDFAVRALGDDNFSVERPAWPKGIADTRQPFIVVARALPREYEEPGLQPGLGESPSAKRYRQASRMARTAVEIMAELD